MPTIQLNNFGGIVPRIHPTLLPANCATIAHNCKLKNGKLVPLKDPSATALANKVHIFGPDKHSISNNNEADSMYIWNLKGDKKFVILFKDKVDFVQGNFFEDEQYKFYIAGDTGQGEQGKDICVVYFDGDEPCILSLYKEAPPAPVVTLTNGENWTDEEKENLRYTFYFQSWVDEFGFESESSGPSNEITYLDGDSVTISAWANAPVTAKKRRIYKVITGLETGGTPQFITEQEAPFSEFTFAIKDEDAAEVMPSIAPSHKISNGMCYCAGGFYAMWCQCTPKTVRFSDGAPSNFPDEYAYEVEYEIIGLASMGNSVVVLTKGNPFLITGTSPDAMVVTKLDALQGCIANRGYCVADGAVYYISKDGLCMIAEGQSSVIISTRDFFRKDDWNKLINSENAYHDIILSSYDDAIYLWNASDGKGYRFDFIEKTSAITTFDENITSVAVDPITDKMYFIKQSYEENIDNTIYAWDDSNINKTMLWRSKRFMQEQPFNLSTAQIYADAYPVKLITDMASSPDKPIDEKQHTEINITNQNARRLPMRRPEKFLELELESNESITDVKLSTSMGGLLNGGMQQEE